MKINSDSDSGGQKRSERLKNIQVTMTVSAQCHQRKLSINYDCDMTCLCCLKLYSNLYVLENLRMRIYTESFETLRSLKKLKYDNAIIAIFYVWNEKVGHRYQVDSSSAMHCTSLHCTALHAHCTVESSALFEYS